MRRFLSIVAVTATGTVLAACNDDGRTLDPAPSVPVSLQTTTTVAAVDAGTDSPTGIITLTSPAFVEGAELDPTFTCDGTNVPPPLVIADVPAGAAELAITVTDRDAGGFVHWAVADIPPSATVLESGVVPEGAVTVRTDSGVMGWDGPCPPPGEPAHTYDFVVYAMAEPVDLPPGVNGSDAVATFERAAIASDGLFVTYASPAA